MTIQLRGYQNDMLGETRAALRQHRAVLMQAPTGAGKTALAATMLGNASSKGVYSLFNVHRLELIEQSAETFERVGIPYGIIAAGFTPNPYAPVQICSIPTLKNRVHRLPRKPGLIVWDECHHVAAAGWSAIFGAFDAKHVGLSATPTRLDGRGLGSWFQHMVRGPSVAWLIENGYLAPYRAFACGMPDLSAVHTRMGDYVRSELSGAMDKPAITGDAVQHYLRHARGKRFIGFCTSRAHSEHVAEEFRNAGIMAVHVDGETDKHDRRAAMQGFREGSITGLLNVGLFGEGVDVPAAEVLIDLAPTQSLSNVMQRWGRVLRPSPGKQAALIFDHAGNMMNRDGSPKHGLPDDEREWSLDDAPRKAGKKKPDGDFPIRQCTQCFFVHRPAPQCPQCGHVYPVQQREIEQVEGDLQEISADEIRARRKQELKSARTEAELITLGIARGYRDPEGWARHRLAEREAWKHQRRGATV